MNDYEPGRRCEICGCESPSAPVCGACEIDERAAAQIDAIEKERDTAIARAEAAETELARLRPLVKAAQNYVAVLVLISDPEETGRASAEMSQVAYKTFADEVRRG